jgi:hypothetical protein
LGITDQLSIDLAYQSDHARIGYLGRLNRLSVAVAAMSRHVPGGIHGTKSRSERRLGDIGERPGVTEIRFTYGVHDNLNGTSDNKQADGRRGSSASR